MNEAAEAARDERLAALLTQLSEAAQQGRAVDLNAVCAEHPELATDLRDLWPAVQMAALAGSHASDTSPPLVWPGDRLTLPALFGDYELLEEVGRGGMGVVYKARQRSLNRIVAVKMVLRGQFASDGDLARFRAEAEAAARLDHGGIVPVYEVGERDGRAYFSMKYVAGQTLLQQLANGPLPPRDAARLLAAVARAIDYAHKHGVLHRDLKPSNILIDEQGQPHVTDFGLAKQVENSVHLTRSGAVLGTPAYMSPEQAAGARGEVGPASDVYSLGTILYHMLTGRPPFQANSPVDLLYMVLEQDPTPPRSVYPAANRDLELIALRCLQKPADLRYDSAAALANDLEAFLKDEVISARSGRLLQVVAGLFRETHHAVVLENWGLLWMWHSLALLVTCSLTNGMHLLGYDNRFYYFALWTAGLGTWAAVFWALRHRQGPVTFVERQIAHVWAASMMCIALLFPLEVWLGFEVLQLSPVLGLVAGMVFLVKAGMLSGVFYFAAAAEFLCAFLMAWQPAYAHFTFGIISAACFFFPGLKYYRQRWRTRE